MKLNVAKNQKEEFKHGQFMGLNNELQIIVISKNIFFIPFEAGTVAVLFSNFWLIASLFRVQFTLHYLLKTL